MVRADGGRSWLDDVDAHVLQPYQAVKVYRCPGCNQEIFPRTLHVVVWPEGEPSRRRHWHKACWERRFAELRRAARRGGQAT